MDLSFVESAADASSSTNAERLLAAMRTACGHDLPNHVLSLKSLIHLLELDEGERLGPAGREYLNRLAAVADKIGAQAGYMKALSKLHRHERRDSEFALAELFVMLRAEMKGWPGTPPTWEVCVGSTKVRSDRDLVYASLVDLVRGFSEGGASPSATTVTAAARPSGERIRVDLVFRGEGMDRAAKIDQRHDVRLVIERLRVADVGLEMAASRPDEAWVTLEFFAERS